MNTHDKESNSDEEQRAVDARVFDLVRSIPVGRVASYGQVGAACEPPVSGYICGRILGRVGADVPWWRVVAKDGALPVRKRAPELGDEQGARLEAEGVFFTEDGRVDMQRCSWDFGVSVRQLGMF